MTNEIEIKKGTEMYVTMSNSLIRAAHGLDINEKRLLMLAVAKLDSRKKATPGSLITRVHSTEFVGEYGINSKNAYTQARLACENLMDRYVRFFHTDKNGKQIETRMQWVGQANYQESEGWVELEFWHRLSPMLFELEELFTSYKLSRAGALRSMYSWRLFELLMQFKTTGFMTILVDDFETAMEAPPSLRNNFSNLRNRIIEPALKEIRDKDGLTVTWEPIKAGRKVKSLEFRFPREQQKQQKALPSTPRPSAETPRQTGKQPDQVTDEARARRDAVIEFNGIKVLAERGKQPIESFINSEKRKEFKRYGLM